MISTLLSFCGAALVLAMIPGPSTAVIVRQAIRGGRTAAFAAIAANELGVLFWASAAALGASAVVAASQLAYEVLRYVGAAVLVVLGFQSLIGRESDSALESTDPWLSLSPAVLGPNRWRSFRVGLITILTNPKAAVFAASFLPQFIPTNARVLPTMLVLAVVWIIVDTFWYVVLVLFLGQVRGVMAKAPVRRSLERVSGAILLGLGVRLALEKR